MGLALGLLTARLEAQRAPVSPAARLRPTVRADLIVAGDPGLQAAFGLVASAAYNVRIGIDAGIGAVRRGSVWQPAGRLDLLARWLSDPFRESRWGINAGGGIGMQFERDRTPRPVAIITLGVEGRRDGWWVPGVEVGLGGGVRAGLTLRRATPRRR